METKSLHKLHFFQLNHLLRDALMESDLDAAKRILSVLIRLDREIPELIWKTGVTLLTQDPEASSTSIRRFYQLMSTNTKDPKLQQQIVLESAFYLASKSRIQEAYETLEARIHTSPYRENALIHGYCGVFAFHIWLSSRDHLTQSGNTWLSNAIGHFETSFQLAMISDYFLLTYCEVRLRADEIGLSTKVSHLTATRNMLEKYVEANPRHLNGLIYLLFFLEKYYPHEVEKLIELGLLIQQIDPVCDFEKIFLPLIRRLQVNNPDWKIKLLVLILTRLDYKNDFCKETVETWKLLANLLPKDKSGGRFNLFLYELMEERKSWWLDFHFKQQYHVDTEEGNQIKAELETYKAIFMNHMNTMWEETWELEVNPSPSQSLDSGRPSGRPRKRAYQKKLNEA